MTATDLPEGLGEPNLRRPDKDADYGFEAWSVLCTTCGYEWTGTPWEACQRCIKRLETERGPHDEYQAVVYDFPPAPQPEGYDDTLRAMLLDWSEFWQTDHHDAEWLAEPLIAAHRSTAIFAPGGTGKSLLALYISACLATGTTMFGRRIEARRVLYLDYEMTADDLAERLEQMGFDEHVDLSNLHYALLPSLPGLDEPEGGKAVVRMAELVDAELVVIDTFGRAVHGDENDADTVRSWYRWTGIHLKHAGRAFVRVDHAGKDLTKGQRGTSAKNDDVDVVWQMTAKEAGVFTLTAKKRRMGWVPVSVDISMREEPWLLFELSNGPSVPAGTAEAKRRLDELDVPPNATTRVALKALRDAGFKVRNEVGRAAQRSRLESFRSLSEGPKKSGRAAGRAPSENGPGALRGAHIDETVKPLVDDLGRAVGRAGARTLGDGGARRRSIERARSTPAETDPIEEVDDGLF